MRFATLTALTLIACRTPVAGPPTAVAQVENKADFLVRRAQERGLTIKQQSAWDAKQTDRADLRFDWRDLGVATQARSLFKTHCAGCHGARGEGMKAAVSYPKLGGFGFRMGMTMSGGKMGRGIYRLLHDGRGLMPPFKDQLANEQLWLLVRYLSAL